MTASPVLVVGFTLVMQKALDAFMPPGSVVFVDEPDVIAKRGLAEKARAACTARLVPFEYQTPAAADRFACSGLAGHPAAVVPAVEYAVPFAARLAERLELPGASFGAASLLRDKHQLRQVARAAGIANPVSRPVSSPEEVRAFMLETNAPAILKPANRQGSVGVRVLRSVGEVDQAWAECIVQDEGVMVPDRGFPLQMLVEELVQGREYSVEALVQSGRIKFVNVTAKFLRPGPYPVEAGHQVPADIPLNRRERLIGQTARLISATGYRTGLIHCEWIVRAGQPHLVECAGRMAGDGIMDLIGWAWGFDPYRSYVDILGGSAGVQPKRPVGGAAVWFVEAAAGVVDSVAGAERATSMPGVTSVEVVARDGGRVNAQRNSWDRVGYVTATADNSREALRRARNAASVIEVSTATAEADVPEPAYV